jgi:hypothetical protein
MARVAAARPAAARAVTLKWVVAASPPTAIGQHAAPPTRFTAIVAAEHEQPPSGAAEHEQPPSAGAKTTPAVEAEGARRQ